MSDEVQRAVSSAKEAQARAIVETKAFVEAGRAELSPTLNEKSPKALANYLEKLAGMIRALEVMEKSVRGDNGA